ncbi:hypothetical protein AADC60_10565 [Cytobacillus pseudoceanisediminis]|uniref:Uncharacterized protein n=1 Tax=Cytobacillus pseudoceanisediminis TaxID=3051614 RepID=A0ABZ2ZRZ2_9BACI
MKLDESLQLLLNEIQDSNKEVICKIDQLENKVNQIKQYPPSNKDKLQLLKFDVEFIADKQFKIEMKLNRIVNMFEALECQ